MPLKYILTDGGKFMIFSNDVIHADAARLLENSCYQKVTSAGFIVFKNGVPHCYGKSESLRLSSDPLDSLIIQKKL